MSDKTSTGNVVREHGEPELEVISANGDCLFELALAIVTDDHRKVYDNTAR